MDNVRENAIEFLRDSKTATVTFSQPRYITRIKELAKEHPEECKIKAVNPDGSIVARIPVKWVKITPPRELSEETRQAAAARMLAVRADSTKRDNG